MSLDRSEGINLINIQYGVVFGAIFSLCFDRNHGSSNIRISISPDNFLSFLFLIIYFFLDWLTANLARKKFEFNDWIIYAWCLAIWYLGSLVVLMNSQGNLRYIGLSLYILTAGLFDLIGYRNIFYKLTTIRSIGWVYLAGMKTIVGFMLLLQGIVVALSGANVSLRFIATIFIAFVSAMKLGRYLLIRDKSGVK